jgi:hypothetical protein
MADTNRLPVPNVIKPLKNKVFHTFYIKQEKQNAKTVINNIILFSGHDASCPEITAWGRF